MKQAPPISPTKLWNRGDETARLLLDLTAGRAIDNPRRVTDEELVLAARHGLLGLMAQSGNQALRDAATPPYARLLARQHVMENHTRRLAQALHDEGVDAAVLKGPALARWVYDNPTVRTFTDIDLLVRPKDVEKSLTILGRDPAVQAIPIKTPKADKRNIIVRDSSGVMFTVDLHWDLFSYRQLGGAALGATEIAWKDSRGIADATLGPVTALPEDVMIAFLCTHAMLDHRFRLILLRDLAEASRRGVNWEQVVQFANRWQLRSTTYATLLMASQIAAAPVPSEALEELRPSSLPIFAAEYLLPRIDVVRFDGHRAHPLNLAVVVLHDDRRQRLRLAMRAPFAFPRWRKRIQEPPRQRKLRGFAADRLPSLEKELFANQESASAGRAKIPVIYITGSNRSGSTLLDRMLGQIPGFASVGELANIWAQGMAGNRLCGCGAEFVHCKFWSAVGLEAFGGWENVDVEEIRRLERSVRRLRFLPLLAFPKSWPTFEGRLNRYAEHVASLYSAIATVSGCQVIVDSSKSPAYGMMLRQVGRLDTRFVHLVRDSRGVAYSWTKKVRRADAPGTSMPQYGVARTSFMWMVSNTSIEVARVLGASVRRIRYEDFVREPLESLREIAAFAGWPTKLDRLQFVHAHTAEMDVAHTVDGNPMRLHTGAVSIDLDSTWESELSRRDKRVVLLLTFPFLWKYRYLSRVLRSIERRSEDN